MMDGQPERVERFRDRREAGALLAAHVRGNGWSGEAIVLALPRGGVPVAFEVAKALQLPLDIFVVRKIGLPSHPELAMGAIASGGVRTANDAVITYYGISGEAFEEAARREAAEIDRRERAYRGTRAPLQVRDRTVFLIDDGLATGATMRAAVAAVRQLGPRRIVVAVPVGSAEACTALREIADDVICARIPEPFSAVGDWYVDFTQTSDDEVRELLASAEEKM
jgi:putative phosphoribosyl transferase